MNNDQQIITNLSPSFLEYFDKLRMKNPTETNENLLKYLYMQLFYNLLEENDMLSLETILELIKIDVLILNDN